MMRVAAIAVLASLAGCVNGPQSWSGAPPLVGELHQAGVPQADTPVRLVSRLGQDGQPNANTLIVESRTDAEGRFSLGPLGRKSHGARASVFGVGESVADWGLQAQQNGQWRPLWSARKTIGYAPRAQVFADCDMARTASESEIAGVGAAARGTGICQLSLSSQRR